MSYAVSAALQEAVFQCLSANAEVQALSGGAIHDAVPSGAVPRTYVALGPEEARIEAAYKRGRHER